MQAVDRPGAHASGACAVAVVQVPERPLRCAYELDSCLLSGQRLAHLLGLPFEGEVVAGPAGIRDRYLVPTDTLVGPDVARRYGVWAPHQLFGGIAPAGFVATKAITQPLVSPHARAPPGWSHGFRTRTHLAVLRGYTVFDRDDGHVAACRLLALGPLRFKPVHGRGGLGQVVAHDMAAVEAVLATLDPATLGRDGIVLEENLVDVVTCSVGQVRVGPLTATYYGTQCNTRNNQGQEVYGGTRMRVVRGDFDRLLARERDPRVRMAIGQARSYDAAARAAYPGVVLSRCNYDVAQGRDGRGRWCSGVLEQSWRLGGATPAELVALEAFWVDPSLEAVRSEVIEQYGPPRPPPDGARVFLDVVDPIAGPVRKFTLCEEDRDA